MRLCPAKASWRTGPEREANKSWRESSDQTQLRLLVRPWDLRSHGESRDALSLRERIRGCPVTII